MSTKRILVLLLVFASVQLFACGQGRVFVAPGGLSNEGDFVLQLGAGGEALLASGFGLTADLGYLFDPDNAGEGLGVFSPGVLYRFNRHAQTTPFVTGGYTLWFRANTLSFGYVGGGIDHWLGKHLGLRFEARDHFRDGLNHFEGRIALLFR